MIPENEKEESLILFLKHEYKKGVFHIDNEDDITVLFDNGMYDIFIDKYLSKKFVCSNPGDKCYKTNFYISLINWGGINDKLIGNLSKAVKGFFPYTLKERLKSEIFSEVANKIKYLETIDRLDLEDFMNLKATEKIEKRWKKFLCHS